MNKIGLVIQREYRYRVGKKSFLLITLLAPLLFAATIFVPLWLSTIKSDQIHTVAILDDTGKYAPLFKDTDNYRFILGGESLEAYRKSPDKEITAFLCITGDLLEDPKAATLYSDRQIPNDLNRIVNLTLSEQLQDDKLATFNIPNLRTIIQESKIDFRIQTVKWGDDGSEQTASSAIASITGGVFTVLIYMFIMIYGGMVMQGVMEEKTNRIVELMISSVKPFDLMMGKILGIGLVGITQMCLWGIMTGILLQIGTSWGEEAGAAAILGDNGWMESLGSIDFMEIGILFVLYFIGGYLLYASLFAAIGSVVDSQEDTQQFMFPVTILVLLSFYAGIYSLENPEGPLAFWGSMIPLSSPIVMMVRIPFEVAAWEILLSLGTLFLSAIAITWLSAKIYRIGILMYGKKNGYKEIIRWLRY